MADKKKGLLGRLFGGLSQAAPKASPVPSVPPITWPKSTTVFSLGIPSKIGDHKVKYRYDDVPAFFSSNVFSPGLSLNLRATGEIYAEGAQIGHYSGEKIRQMVLDFYDRGDPVVAKLYRMNEDGSALIYVAFYKTPHYTSERRCKVSGTGSASRQEEIGLLSIGDELYLEESSDVSGRVDVSDLGYLGPKDSTWALDELNLESCETTVAAVEENENGKLVLTVRIRY